MTWLHTITQFPAVSQLSWTLVHVVWEGFAIALALQIVLAALRRRTPQARYAYGCVAMGLLALAPILSYWFLEAPRSESKTPGQPSQVAAQSTLNKVFVSPSWSTSPNRERTTSDTPTSPADLSAKDEAFVSEWLEQKTAALTRIAPWLVAAWAVGVLILSIRNLGAWVAVRQMRSLGTTQTAGESIGRMAASLSARLGLRRAIGVLQSARVDSPLVIGFFKPIILLPASVLTELPAAQVEALLAHELAHVLRNDYLVNLLQCGVETVLFYHPAVWWISRQVRIEREHCCDDIAVSVTQKRETYVCALAALADVRVTRLIPAASGSVLIPRLRRILSLPNPDLGRSSLLTGLIALAACLLIVVSCRPMLSARATADRNEPQHSRPLGAGDLDNVIGPGDLLWISASVDLNRKLPVQCTFGVRVDAAGQIGMPRVGAVKVAGLTPEQAKVALEKTLTTATLRSHSSIGVLNIEIGEPLGSPLVPVQRGDWVLVTLLVPPVTAYARRVAEDGAVDFPFLRKVNIGGMTETTAQEAIENAYAQQHPGPQRVGLAILRGNTRSPARTAQP